MIDVRTFEAKAPNRTRTVRVPSVHSPYVPFRAVQYEAFGKLYGIVQETCTPYALIVQCRLDILSNPKLNSKINIFKTLDYAKNK